MEKSPTPTNLEKSNVDRHTLSASDMANSVAPTLLAIQSMNSYIATLIGSQREQARQRRDQLLEELVQITRSNWRVHVRLTIMDSSAQFHQLSDGIIFRNTDGSIASPEDVCTAGHIMAMPDGAEYKAADIETTPGLLKLDQDDVEWIPIFSDPKFLIIRFTSGRLYLISNAYGIRALVTPGI